MLGENIPLRQLSRIVIVYMLLAFAWWAVQLWRANEHAFHVESALLELKHGGKSAGVNLTQLHETAEFRALERRYHKHHRMILAEGIFFTACLLFGLWMINRSANREVVLARQRRNFLLSITHELKSPIAGMRLVFETIARRELTREQLGKLCSNGLRDADRLQNLVNDILLAARLEENWRPSPEQINLQRMVSEVANSLAVRFPAANIRLEIPSDFPLVKADAQGLTAIVQNLLENALKYSPEGSPVVFSAEKLPSGKVCLRVADNGPGIPDTEKQQVFEKFYRLGNEETRSATGTGLGLFIVRQVVQAHGGKVQLTDNQPHGAVFTITVGG